ncbi:GIY-YIG nuclease family protein [Pedobacter gandavensis]|uniref:GIY-YIG catalytic domain-containing protein n=1 Tax=Pedobacter gandavensis TaxID=2679963 RepID=A0ABR6EZ71_9SPHI|nr:hypothetical protein [Pedobacter gandavensis]MBB2150559.1 hypothetical protein [Pedobacter gandavensis]
MLENILQSIRDTAKLIDGHLDYPTCPGIYAFMLKDNASLKEFGTQHQIIYVGIAKESLKKRDLGNHFKSSSTGSSTLRRSIGAILKEELSLIAFSRNGTNNKREILNYTFNDAGNNTLTKWMLKNLIIGYWKDGHSIPYSKLRSLEEDVIKILKPTLDLDARTKKYNVLANHLDNLRKVCREEALKDLKK